MNKKRRHLPRANLLLSLHRWCGLLALVFLLLAALSGSILVYKQALVKWIITPDAELPEHYTSQQLAPQLDRIALLIKNDRSSYLIKAPNKDEPYWSLTRDVDGHVQLLALDSLEPYNHNLWLLDVLAFVRHLHTELFSGVIGETILLVTGTAGLFLALSGILLWWKTRRSFRWRWVFPKRISWLYLMHYHRHSGALALPILTVILLTGSIMLWQKLTGPILTPLATTQVLAASKPSTAAHFLLQAQQQVPDGRPTYIRLPSANAAFANVRFRLPDEWHNNGRTSVKIDSNTGELSVSVRSDQAPWQHQLINQNYPLHSGYGMNPVYRFFIFVTGIVLLWLSITGGLHYFRRNTQ